MKSDLHGHIIYLSRYILCCALTFFLLIVSNAQNETSSNFTDSLEQNIKTQLKNRRSPNPSDTVIIENYLLWESEIAVQEPDLALELNFKALNLAHTLKRSFPNTPIEKSGKAFLADIYNNIGYIYAQIKSDSKKGIDYFTKAQKLYEELNDLSGISTAYNNLGYIFDTYGNIAKALEYYHKSLKINEQSGDQEGIAISYNNIANIYDYQDDTDKALEYYLKSLEIWEKLNDSSGLALAYNNLGAIYEDEDKIDMAIRYYNMSLNIYLGENDREGIAMLYNNIGYTHSIRDNRDSALLFYHKSIAISKEIGDRELLISAYHNMANIFMDEGKIAKAKPYIIEAYKMSKAIAMPYDIETSAALMKELAIKEGDYQKAFVHYQEEISMRDSVQNESNFKLIQKQEAFYEYEKQAAIDSMAHQKAIQIKDLQITKQQAESDKQKAISLFTIIGLFVVLIFFAFVLRLLMQKKKANRLLAAQKNEIVEKNEELNQLVEEVTTQRNEIESKKHQIEKIHYELSNSIDYATRLQKLVLPDTKVLQRYFSDHFALLKPKDKVSGDFYWWTHIENHTVIAGVDCTGHGVPGAFMSMLGISFLREIVQKEYITHSGVILRKLRKEIIRTLRQKDETGTHKDGMDMALISINHDTKMAQFSGANNPIYIIKKGELGIKSQDYKTFSSPNNDYILYEIKADKMPIAIYDKMDRYTTHELQLEADDQVYLFSDGFPDQFGGPKDKKFKYKPFKEILLEHAHKPMAEQKIILNKTFEDWKGYSEQIDDVVVIGIKV